jgi:sulfate adenylyltransferase
LNIRRIGYVASEITKARGIAISAAIAPYEESRKYARELISKHGGFVELYLSTPLEVCEKRDRKGLYAKARKGLVKGFTGIDDPYEVPANAELAIDTSKATVYETVEAIVKHLQTESYL